MRWLRLFQDPRCVVVSFPKSGRTWLRVMLDSMGVGMDYTHDGADHRAAVHYADLKLCGRQFMRQSVILLIRDPKDTAVSGFFQVGKRLSRDDAASIADFVRSPHHGIEKIVRFNLTWLEKGWKKERFLPLTYEGLTRNTVSCMQAVLRFASVERPLEEVRQVIDDHTFQKMREREQAGVYGERYGRKLTPRSVDDAESYKVRRGKIGGYRDYLSPEDVAYCDAVLGRYGYDERVENALRAFGAVEHAH